MSNRRRSGIVNRASTPSKSRLACEGPPHDQIVHHCSARGQYAHRTCTRRFSRQLHTQGWHLRPAAPAHEPEQQSEQQSLRQLRLPWEPQPQHRPHDAGLTRQLSGSVQSPATAFLQSAGVVDRDGDGVSPRSAMSRSSPNAPHDCKIILPLHPL